MCLKTNFKHPNKSQVQRCKVVLKDIFKCKVLLKRLTPGQIARALRGESIFAQNEHYAHQDHCYSRASIVRKNFFFFEIINIYFEKFHCLI